MRCGLQIWVLHPYTVADATALGSTNTISEPNTVDSPDTNSDDSANAVSEPDADAGAAQRSVATSDANPKRLSVAIADVPSYAILPSDAVANSVPELGAHRDAGHAVPVDSSNSVPNTAPDKLPRRIGRRVLRDGCRLL